MKPQIALTPNSLTALNNGKSAKKTRQPSLPWWWREAIEQATLNQSQVVFPQYGEY